jgi:hypothetical protein
MKLSNWRDAASYLSDPCYIASWIRFAARVRVLDCCCDDLEGSIQDPGYQQAIASNLREAFYLMGLPEPSLEIAMDRARDYMAGIQHLGEICEQHGLLGDAKF